MCKNCIPKHILVIAEVFLVRQVVVLPAEVAAHPVAVLPAAGVVVEDAEVEEIEKRSFWYKLEI